MKPICSLSLTFLTAAIALADVPPRSPSASRYNDLYLNSAFTDPPPEEEGPVVVNDLPDWTLVGLSKYADGAKVRLMNKKDRTRVTIPSKTATEMGFAGGDEDARLDELQYWAMAAALEAEHGIAPPEDATAFAAHLPQMIRYWAEDRVEGVPERFSEFRARTTGLVEEVCKGHGRILMVTSGGVIGTILRHVLHLSDVGMAKIMLQVMNSSVHRLEYVHGQLYLGSFNATPHLDIPGREHARTFI